MKTEVEKFKINVTLLNDKELSHVVEMPQEKLVEAIKSIFIPNSLFFRIGFTYIRSSQIQCVHYKKV